LDLRVRGVGLEGYAGRVVSGWDEAVGPDEGAGLGDLLLVGVEFLEEGGVGWGFAGFPVY